MLSYQERIRRRGGSAVFFKPPGEHATREGWHEVATHDGTMILRWVPGIEVWKRADGQRWNTETAGALKWVWISAVIDGPGG